MSQTDSLCVYQAIGLFLFVLFVLISFLFTVTLETNLSDFLNAHHHVFMYDMKNKHVTKKLRIFSVDVEDTRLIPNGVLCVLAHFRFVFGFSDTIYVHLNFHIWI